VAGPVAQDPERRIVVQAAALRAGEHWIIAVEHPSPVTVEVAQLEDVDEAVGKALAEQLGDETILASVDIHWYRAAPRPDE
jgi:hypothetical protein